MGVRQGAARDHLTRKEFTSCPENPRALQRPDPDVEKSVSGRSYKGFSAMIHKGGEDAMAQDDYRRPPEEIDMPAEEHAIRKNTTLAFLITVAAFTGAYSLVPAFVELPTGPADRLAFAAVCWALPGLVLIVAIMMVSTARRFSPDDIGGQAAGPPGEKLAIKAAFLQNTLEQTVAAGAFYFAWAALAGGSWMALLPVAAALFVVGRVLFFLGYRQGARGRALGMSLTLLPTVLGFVILPFLVLFGH